MVYSFPWYVPGIATAIAVLAAGIGALLFWKSKPPALIFTAVAVAALAGGLIAPMLALDRVVLSDEKLEQTTGFWFAPTVKGFRLADVDSITIGTARDAKGREYEVWNVRLTGGQLKEIDPGDLWEMNDLDIIQRLEAKGIEVKR